MAKSELEIIIDENGDVHVDIKGMKGKKCVAIAEMIQKVICEMKNQKHKPEYYETDVHIDTQIDTEQNK
jgi:hypothetical protein